MAEPIVPGPATPTVPGYSIEAVAGRGGMGVVYVATQVWLGRRVALKVLDVRFARDRIFRERFLAESRIAASLEHPNIVPIYDAGGHEGLLYIAMRFLGGGDLSGAIRRHGRLAPTVVIRLLGPIADALDTAHGRGLVHRDVKPGNILLDDDALSERTTSHLSDFGISRRTTRTSALTEPGQFIGTIEYAPPEQLRGSAGVSSDQYALASVAFECLTGQRPFGGATPAQLIQDQLETPVPGLGSLHADLSESLDAPLQRAMAKSPTDRYESCRVFVEALAAAAAAPRRAVSAPSSSLTGRPSRTHAVDPLSMRVGRICDELARIAPKALSEPVARIRAGLDEPLRVVIAGRVKAGKSTLVNALLRERVAPTNASECTRVTTVFRYGPARSVEIRPRVGDARIVPLRQGPEGNADIDLGADPSELDSVVIHLANDVLRSMTLVDTPGLASLDERSAAMARDTIDPVAGATGADALIFLLPAQPTAGDIEAIRQFRSRFESLEYAAGNAFGVLSRADQLGGDGDPWLAASTRAASLAAEFAHELGTVIPAIGLLAESADHIRESDVAALRQLAGAITAAERSWTLIDAEVFLDADLPVVVRDRDRLVRLLGMYGLARALAAVDIGINTAAALGKHLEETSGIHAIRTLLLETLASRADAIRAQSAIASLESLSEIDTRDGQALAAHDFLAAMHDAVERLQLDPQMHRLAELHAGHALKQRSDVSSTLLEDVDRILGGVSPAWRVGLGENAGRSEIMARAMIRHEEWRRLIADASITPDTRRLAQVFARSYAIVAA